MKRFFTIAALATAAIVVSRTQRPGQSLASRIGQALRFARSGDMATAFNDPTLRALPRFDLESEAFAPGTPMPAPYIDAGARQPPLTWSGLPIGTVELALIVEDIDVPLPRPLVHAIAYGFDPARTTLVAGTLPRPGERSKADPAIQLGRGAGGCAFLAPTPIPGHGPHRYMFEVFALSDRLTFDRPPNKTQLLRALRKVAIGRAMTIGTHENP